MASPCKLLLHDIFLNQYTDAIAAIPKIEKPLIKQLEKIKADPVGAGEPMRDIPLTILQGKIFRVWVGGRTGYRLIYIYDPDSDIALPVFVSTQPKARFDYEDVPWREIAEEIYQDLVQGNDEKFTEITTFAK